ncbi:MAG TPA: 50S ribosomal protein L6 [Candidatus Saccharimonadales bacterium]|jgi:large subunit ribosomal protein L6|nr:50S ribosomal protein L6 [Candidatus Saccharimonadales bacterium]
MSRIGKLPIVIPSGVTITVDSGNVVVTGPKGTLSQFVLPEVDVTIDSAELTVTRKGDEKLAKSQHGLMRALINNMVVGTTKGFEKKLEINGVGFRVSGGGNSIEMGLGFSHPVKYQSKDGVNLVVEKNTITVSGISKQQVGQVAAEIRSLKKPEPYKGKGIKYVGEQIIRKAGKTGK